MPTKNLKLTRDQLKAFLDNHDQIKQFEMLFQVVDEVSAAPDTLGISIESGSAYAAAAEALSQIVSLAKDSAINSSVTEAKANQAIDSLARIANALDLIASEPAKQNNNSIVTDYIDFDGSPPHADRPRRVVWNNNDDTLNVHHTGGVVQQVGLEQYIRFSNDTGVTIPDATVVGLDFIGGSTTDDVVPYLADGSVPMLNIIGVTTQEILDGEIGRATVFGVVRNIDTTGTPYGEVWAAGDGLYASPTIPGGFTNEKPTAPAWRIPIALVLISDATQGQIFVRPTIDQPLYYGEFVKTSTTSPAAINTAYPLTFNSTTIANGLSIGGTPSRIIAEFPGLYKFSPSIQLVSGSASVKNVWFWFRKNGVDIANSATIVSVDSGTAIIAPSMSILISLDAGDYVEIIWASDSTNVSVQTTAATAFAPQSPSIILVVTQEQQ